MDNIIVSSSPHVHSKTTISTIMGDVIIALMPALIAGVYFFGIRSALVVAVTVAFAVAGEWIFEKIIHKKSTINDYSAVVTGLLLALNLPPTLPWWEAVLGGVFAIVIVKMMFGGLGQNFMNPALGARCFLLIAFAGFMVMTVKAGMDGRTEEEEVEALPMMKSLIFIGLGLAGIVWGGDLSVEGAKEIARFFGLSEAIIGLTIVALGTSLPELVTSIIAAKKGESDIAVGNVIGSNIFNIFLILGVSSTILPMNVSSTYLYDIGMLIAVMVLTYLPIAKTKRVTRGMGIAMVLVYVAYTVYLIMR